MTSVNKSFEDDEGQVSKAASCCSRLRSELCSAPFYTLLEPNGKIIDVEESFAHDSWRTLIYRLLSLGVTVATMTYDILRTDKENRYIYMGYLTRWTLVAAVLYQVLAILCTIFRRTLEQPGSEDEQRPKLLVRFMWTMYSMVAPAYIIVTVLYWSLDYEPGKDEISIRNVMLHGGIAILVWFDGLVIALIPLRMKQIFVILTFSALYLAWTAVHDFTDIGDGDWSNEDDTDPKEDSLYEALSWSNDWQGAAILSAVVVCGISPATFLVCWILSLWAKWCKFDGSRRRICADLEWANSNSTDTEDRQEEEEEDDEVDDDIETRTHAKTICAMPEWENEVSVLTEWESRDMQGYTAGVAGPTPSTMNGAVAH